MGFKQRLKKSLLWLKRKRETQYDEAEIPETTVRKRSLSNSAIRKEFIDACQFNDTALVTKMLDRGFDVNSRAFGATGLHYVVVKHRSIRKILPILLKAPGLDLDARGLCEATALHEACGHNRPVAVRMLLEAGASRDLKTETGSTPIDYAIELGNPKCVEVMVDFDCQLSEGNRDHDTVKKALKLYEKKKRNCKRSACASR